MEAKRVRLADIDPAAVALDIALETLSRFTRDAARLAPLVKVTLADAGNPESARRTLVESPACRDAFELACWARDGTGDPRTMEAVLQAVTTDIGAPRLPEGMPCAARDVVLVAARARLTLAADKPVSAVEIAVLAGVHERTIRSYVTTGRLFAEDPNLRPMMIPAAVARAELAARAVHGFRP